MRAHTHTHCRFILWDTRRHSHTVQEEMENFFSAGLYSQKTLERNCVFEAGNINMEVTQRRSCICMQHTDRRYVNESGVCRALQAFCGAHRWLHWAVANAHCVNKTTRQAQQMLHKSGFDRRNKRRTSKTIIQLYAIS